MRRDIGDALAVQEHGTAVTQAAHIVVTTPRHTERFIAQSTGAIKVYYDSDTAIAAQIIWSDTGKSTTVGIQLIDGCRTVWLKNSGVLAT